MLSLRNFIYETIRDFRIAFDQCWIRLRWNKFGFGHFARIGLSLWLALFQHSKSCHRYKLKIPGYLSFISTWRRSVQYLSTFIIIEQSLQHHFQQLHTVNCFDYLKKKPRLDIHYYVQKLKGSMKVCSNE